MNVYINKNIIPSKNDSEVTSLNVSCSSSPLIVEYRFTADHEGDLNLFEDVNTHDANSTAPTYIGSTPIIVLIKIGRAVLRVLMMKEY